MSDVDAAFGGNVRVRRMRDAISQRAFGQLLVQAGMVADASAVSRIESGERSVRLAEAVLIAEVLGCGLMDLLPSASEPAEVSQAKAVVDVAISELMKLRESL